MTTPSKADIDALFGVDVDELFEDESQRPADRHVAALMIANNIAMAKQYGPEFQRLFGMSLGRFIHPFFGFDIIRLDDWLKPPDGTSIRDAVLARWGEDAVALIETLIDPLGRGKDDGV